MLSQNANTVLVIDGGVPAMFLIGGSETENGTNMTLSYWTLSHVDSMTHSKVYGLQSMPILRRMGGGWPPCTFEARKCSLRTPLDKVVTGVGMVTEKS